MYGLDRRYTGVRREGIQVDLLRIIFQKIDLSNPLFEEKHIEDAIKFCGSKSHQGFLKRFSDPEFSTLIYDLSEAVYFSENISGFILNGWKNSRERSRARLIP